MNNDRSKFIGSSDAPAVLGVSSWSTPYQVWLRKGEHAQPEVFDAVREKYFKRGKRLEPVVVEMLLDEYPGLTLLRRNERYADKELPFLATEIDAEVSDPDGELINVEIKTVHASQAREWGEEGTDEIPIAYAAQCMHGLMVTGRELSLVAALIGADDLRVYKVMRDPEFIVTMREREVAFWQENVLAGVPPDPMTHLDLKLRYPRDSGKEIEANESIADLAAALAKSKGDFSAMDKAIKEGERTIQTYMKDASVLTYKERVLATWRLQSRKAYPVEASEFRVLRIKN
jgi:putative phage-type endonuclease